MIYYNNSTYTDQQFSLYLIKKYLEKHFSNNAIKLIMTKYTPTQIARLLGEKDISFFCLYYLRDTFVPASDNKNKRLSKDHYDLWELANRMFVRDELDKANIICPRGFAKTTIFNLAVISWCICYKKSIFNIIISKDTNGAEKFLDEIKKLFRENKLIIDEFGELINNKKFTVNSTEIEFSNGCDLQSVGSSTSIRGRKYKNNRPTLVIGDDAQDDKDILTEDSRDKKYNTWCNQVDEVGTTATYRHGKKISMSTKIISIGTVLHHSCLVSRLSRDKNYYTILKRAIILEPDQTVDDIFESELWLECKRLLYNDKDIHSRDTAKQFYLNNKDKMKFPVLWEDSWDCFDDLAVKYWANRRSFMSEKMNDATSIGEKWFKSVRTQSKSEIEEHKFIRTMLCIDPASTQTKRSDYTAMIVASKSDNDFKYIRDITLDKFGFNQYCNKVIELLHEYEDITHIYIEKNTFSGADLNKIKELISEDKVLKNRRLEFINEMQRANKDEKISTIIDNVNNGQIIFVDNNKLAIEQLLEFQGQKYSTHDDFVDVVAEFSNRVDTIVNVKTIKLYDKNLLF